jgi:hypothetical protein
MMSLLLREAACASSCILEIGLRVLELKVEIWNGFPRPTKRGEFSTTREAALPVRGNEGKAAAPEVGELNVTSVLTV